MENKYPLEKQNSQTPQKNYQKPPSDLLSLYAIYQNEFIDSCENILVQKESDFLKTFFHKMMLIFLEDYGGEVYDNFSFQKATKDCENQFYENIYKPMYSLCQKALDNFGRANPKQIKQKDFGYLTNFRSHCLYNQVPIHTCKGRFITVNDPNNQSKTLYVICTSCKMCYFESSILMLCVNCKKEFYSSVISNLEKILPPATWEKYHCNIMYNAQMDCIKCKDKFWIKNSNLYCKNCKFLISPLDVTWNCVICHKDFQSNVKVYNSLEFKLIKLAARNALLYKRIIKPKELPCKCFSDLDSVVFTHKPNCPGILYHGTVSGKDTVFCSHCQTFCTLNKYYWFCPKCKKNFITKNVRIYKSEYDLEESSSSPSSSNNTSEQKINNPLYGSTIVSSGSGKTSNPLYSSVVVDGPKKYMTGTNNSNSGGTNRNIQPILFDPVDNYGVKKRNFSINILNRNNSKQRKNQSLNNNYDNYDECEDYIDESSSPNTKLKIHVIKHPQKRRSNLVNKNLERNHLNIYGNLQTQRCNTIESDYSNKDKNGYQSFNRASTLGNYSNADGKNPEKEGFKSYQIFLTKKTINMSGSKYGNNSDSLSTTGKNSLYETPQTLKEDPKIAYSNSKGFNRYRLNYESPCSDRKNKPIITFNMDESEQREKFREYLRKNDESNFSDKSESIHPEIRRISVNKKQDQRRVTEISNDSKSNYMSNNNHNRLLTSPGKQLNLNSDLLVNSPIMTQNAINIHNNNNNSPNQLKEFNFQDYQIITQLGQGTFGKIYLVEDKNKNIFSMKKIILNEELDLEGIIKEYQLAHRLQHQNIIEILGFYTKKLDVTTFVIYILMEVGLTDWEKEIKSHIDKKKYYTENELINILSQMVSGLSFLQTQGVSHRDIKPQNVLIFKNRVYKIADFGEAKQITKLGQNRQINTLRGTELYMSPLLFNGLKTNQLDIKHNLFKSDVYSLGLCILFAATLTVNSIYEIRKLVDMKSVRSFLTRIMKEKYSINFISLLGDMLEINERFRPDFMELKKRLGV